MVSDSKSPNQWADFWRYEKGLNVFPADTRNKRTYEEWKKWQNEPISGEQHEEWKNNNAFSNGMAIIAGKVWHIPDLEGYHFCFIDLDNQKAIDEVCEIFGAKDIDELAQKTIVEQHRDNKSKAHVYYYTQYVLKKKSSDATRNLKEKLDSNEIPAIEVKCQSDGIAYCTPSPHKDGHNYEIIGTTKMGTFNGKEIEEMLLEVYKKYELITGISTNGDTNKIPIKKLLESDLVIEEGHNRHGEVLRVIESLYAKKDSKSFEGIYNEAWHWNQTHCNPPLTQSEFDRQWKDGIRFVNQTNNTNNQVLQQQLNFQNDENTIYKIVDYKIPYEAYYIDEKLGQICYGEVKDEGIIPKKVIFSMAPKKLIFYTNPIFPHAEPKVRLEYYDKGNEQCIHSLGPLNNTNEVLRELQIKNYVLNKAKAEDAFNSIITAMKENEQKGMIEYVEDVTTFGYYLIKNKLVIKNATKGDIKIEKEDAMECCKLLNQLADSWKDKSIFPTVLKWVLLAPFSFIIKWNRDDNEWMPWLQLYGQGKSGKTTLGLIALYVWNKKPTTHNKGFSNIDTPARLGEVVRKDTHPILVNEVGSLYEIGKVRKYTNVIEMIKHAIESSSIRGKFVDYNRYEEIPALSPLILTSNYAPPNDGSLLRRFISIHFPKDEKKDNEEQLSFKKVIEDKKKYFPIVGRSAVQYIERDPSILLKKDWKEIGKEILVAFYKHAGLEIPEWIDYFVEQRDAIDESNEKTQSALRAFLGNKINEVFGRNCRDNAGYESIDQRLKYCLERNLIPFFHLITDEDEIQMIITHDIIDEINDNWSKIENITGLKDVGTQIGFEYGPKYLNKTKTRVIFGSVTTFKRFLQPEFSSNIEH